MAASLCPGYSTSYLASCLWPWKAAVLFFKYLLSQLFLDCVSVSLSLFDFSHFESFQGVFLKGLTIFLNTSKGDNNNEHTDIFQTSFQKKKKPLYFALSCELLTEFYLFCLRQAVFQYFVSKSIMNLTG